MQFEKVVAELKKIGAKRVFIQYPEGIKRKIQETVSKLEKEGIESVVCLEWIAGIFSQFPAYFASTLVC